MQGEGWRGGRMKGWRGGGVEGWRGRRMMSSSCGVNTPPPLVCESDHCPGSRRVCCSPSHLHSCSKANRNGSEVAWAIYLIHRMLSFLHTLLQ